MDANDEPATGAGPPPATEPPSAAAAASPAGTADSSASASPGPAGLSKKAQKRLLRQQQREATREQFLARRREKRKELRERQRQRKREQAEAAAASSGGEGPAASPAAGAPPPRPRRPDIVIAENAPTVVIDLAFEHLMSDGEITSVCRQVSYCYGTNRRSERPVRLVATGIAGRIKARFEGPDRSSQQWKMAMETRPFQELFPKESLVYLTADSPNVLQAIEDGKVYIIGGLVDRNRHKNLCYNLAVEQGIAHAQLPIGDVLDMKTRKVLAVNHVLEILLRFRETGSWAHSIATVMPTRKEFSVRSPAASGGEGAADTERPHDGDAAGDDDAGRDRDGVKRARTDAEALASS